MVLEVVSALVLGIRKTAPDYHSGHLPVQQPHVLSILCILCIEVYLFNWMVRTHRMDLEFPAASPNPVCGDSGTVR